MKHYPHADVPQCNVRIVLDEQGVWPLHCLVEHDGEIVGQLPINNADFGMKVGSIATMRLDIIGKWAKVEYAPDPE